MIETTKKDRPWNEYPVGTKAFAIMGGHWIRTERGWKWCNGATFPQPGGDASGEVQLPPVVEKVETPDQDKRIFVSTGNGGELIVHLEEQHDVPGSMRQEGKAYWAVTAEHLGTDKPIEWLYRDSRGSGDEHPILCETSDLAFSFTFCHRGVWEDRIYFPNDNEYWHRELRDMADAWDILESHLKDMIKKNNPEYTYWDQD